jgi:thiosulfate dehydrogenase
MVNSDKKYSDNVKRKSFPLALTFAIVSAAAIIAVIVVLENTKLGSRTESITSFDQAAYDRYITKIKGLEELDAYWNIPELASEPDSAKRAAIRYGKELIVHTSEYLGPNGSVEKLSNGMNCQNCHLDAGTKVWGNNYGAVASTYPKVRARSGQMEDIEKRINDCFERSLNGKALRTDSKEMKAMVAYMHFLGKHVAKDSTPEGTGIYKISYLSRPADPVKGAGIYSEKCASCHGENGEGMLAMHQKEYTYPPLWGPNSYNSGAGLFRLSRLAGYIKYNMPYGADYLNPQMSDADCWDVGAFINSQPRPEKDISKDWPDISKKPIDHPFGPFSDGFSEKQHKYGPFGPIEKARKALKSN